MICYWSGIPSKVNLKMNAISKTAAHHGNAAEKDAQPTLQKGDGKGVKIDLKGGATVAVKPGQTTPAVKCSESKVVNPVGSQQSTTVAASCNTTAKPSQPSLPVKSPDVKVVQAESKPAPAGEKIAKKTPTKTVAKVVAPTAVTNETKMATETASQSKKEAVDAKGGKASASPLPTAKYSRSSKANIESTSNSGPMTRSKAKKDLLS